MRNGERKRKREGREIKNDMWHYTKIYDVAPVSLNSLLLGLENLSVLKKQPKVILFFIGNFY